LALVLDELSQLSATTNMTDREKPVAARKTIHGTGSIHRR
jgi:hypothetical protein